MPAWLWRILDRLQQAHRPRCAGRCRRATVSLGLLRLEDRRVMSADVLALLDSFTDDLPEASTVHAGTSADDGHADTFRVVRSGHETHVLVNDELVFSGAAADSLRLRIVGSGDDDRLLLDLAGGDLLGTILFEGGGSQVAGDSVVLTGGADSVTWAIGAGGTGAAAFDGGGVHFTGVESADDGLQARDRRIGTTSGAGDVQLVGSGGRSLLEASEGLTLAFASPGESLTVRSSGNVLEMTGTIAIAGGEVRLDAGTAGTLLVGGDIDVSSHGPGATGGRVELLGRHVGLIGEARVDASGTAGAGTVLIGGDYQGLNADVHNAARTYVGSGVTITADALDAGDGGRVIVWADEVTRFHGTITARGGANGGDGGFAETSGKQDLVFRGTVDLSATHGARGTLLLDPDTIEIAGGAGPALNDLELDANIPTPGDPEGQILFADGAALSFTISEGELESLSADVVLEATNRIFVSGTFDNDGDGVGVDDPGADVVLIGGGQSLTLRTRNDAGDGTTGIDLTAAGALNNLEFKTTGAGTITIETGTGATPQAAPVRLGRLTAGGGIAVNASGTVTVAGVLAADGAAAVSIVSGGDIVLLDGSEVRSNDGNITLSADGDVSLSLVNADGDSAGAAGTVSIIADAGGGGIGAILDNTAAETPLIVGAAAELRAGSGIGDQTNALELAVGTLAATTVTGDVTVRSSTALVVDTVLATSGVSIAGGAAGDDIDLSVDSATLTVNQTIANPTGAITLAAAGMTLANSAISIGGGTLQLDVAAGSIDVTTDAGAEISANGDIVLLASNMGAANGGLDITGDASGDSTLSLTATAAGTIDLDFATDQFSAVVITLEDAGAAVSIDLSAGDAVVVSGAAGVSTVDSVVTTSLQATLDLRLTEAAADLVLHTGTVTAGADVIFQSVDDIVVGDAAGTAVSAGTGVSVTLVADSETDGIGAIVDGGGTIALDGGDLRLVAGSGIGSSGSPIEVTGLTNLAAATQTGGVFVRNSGTGDVTVASVTTFSQTTNGVTAASGAIELTNAAGTITADLLQTNGGTDADDITLIATALEVNTLSAAGLGDVSLTATTGDIDDTDANSSITADALTLSAAGGIGLTSALQTQTSGSLSLTTAGLDGTGDIELVEANALATSRILTLATDASTQTVSLTSTAGPVTIDGNLGDAADHLVLVATAGDIVGGAGTLTATNLSLTALSGGIGIGTAVNTDTSGTLNLATGGLGSAGDIQVVEANGLVTSRVALSTAASAQTVSLTSTSGPITLDAGIGNATDSLVLIAATGNIVGGAGTAIADNLTLAATSGGIGIGTAVNTDTLGSLVLTTGGADAAGNIRLIEANALATLRLTVSTAASQQSVEITSNGGSITVDAGLGDAADDLALTAGSIVGGLGTLTADDLALTATVGGVGTGTPVNTDTAGLLTLSTAGADAAGNIQIVEANALALSRIFSVTTAASAQTVSLTSTAGPITVDVNFGNAVDHLTLTATNGDIVGGAGTLTADDLTLAATTGGIGTGTSVTTDTTGTISLSTGGAAAAGNIRIVEANALNTSRVLLATAGSEQLVSITSTAGPITVDGNLGNSTDDLTLIAAAGDIEGGAGTLFANDLILEATLGGIGLVTPVNTDTTGTLTLVTGGVDGDGNISVVEANALDTSRLSVTTHTSEQLVAIASGGTVTIDASLGTAADDLSLTGTAIEGGAGTLTADDLFLTASVGGIGVGTAVDTDTTGTITLSTAGLNGAGDIQLVEANALPTSRIGGIITDGSQQIVRLTSTDGPITVDANLGNTVDDLVLIASAGDIEGGAGTLTAAGLALEATIGGIGLVNAVNTSTTAGVDLVTGGAGSAGNIRVIEANALATSRLTVSTAASQQSVEITSNGGSITVDAGLGDAADDLALTAGSIVGGLGTLTADDLTLTATVGGIGTGTPVNTDTAGLLTLSTAGADAAGNIQIVEANALALSRIFSVTTAASAQTVSLTSTAGPLTVDVNFGNAVDHLTLTATNGDIVGGGGTLTADDLTLAATTGGIGIGAAVSTDTTGTISLSTGGAAGAGNIRFVEANALNTSRVLLATAGSEQLVSITSTAGPITVDGNLGNTTDDLTLIAAAGDIEGGAGTLFANDLILEATLGGIGLVTPVDTDSTGTLTLVTGGTDGDGNVSVVEANALDTSRLSVTTHTSEQVVAITSGGTLTVDADFGNATDDLTLLGTEIEGGGGTLTADDLILSATVGGLGVVTAVDTDTTGTITLSTAGVNGAGDIQLVEANALPTSRIAGIVTDGSQQIVRLTSTAGPITVDANLGNTVDDLVLVASAGDIEGGAGTLTAAGLTLEAATGGIGLVNAVNTSTTASVNLVTGGAGTDGNIRVIEANALDTLRLSFSTAADEQVVDITSNGGSITVGGNVGNSTDDLVLTAGSIEGGAGTLTADDLTLTATAGGIGTGTPVNTDTAGLLTLFTAGADAAGNIQIVEANALALSRIFSVTTAASAQTVSLTSTAGPLTVDVNFGNAVDHLTLTATNGDIVGGAGTLTADDLTLAATTGGIGIGTAVTTDTTGTISLSTGGAAASGNIGIVEANALAASRIAFVTGADEQLVSITSTAGPITVDAGLGNTTDDLILVASSGDIEGGAGTLFASDLTLEATIGGIGLITAVEVSITGCLTVITGGSGSAGDINVTSDSPLVICGITTDPGTQQSVSITSTAGGDLTIDDPISTNDDLVLATGGSIDVNANVSARNLTLQAGATVDVAAGARLIAGGDGTALIITATDVVLGAGTALAAATVTNTGTGAISITAAGGDITLDNNAISVGQGLLTLSAVGNSILSTTDPGTEIDADGDVTLIATSIGPANGGVDFTGDGSGNSTLTVTATAGSGDVNLDWATDQFDAIVLVLDDADTDVLITFSAGDGVNVSGETASGLPGTSTVQFVDTTGLAATLHVELTEVGADLLLATGAVTLGAEGCFLSEDDLIVGDAAGTAVTAGPGVNITLVADSDGDGFGAIIDGGGTITMDGGALRLSAGSGIGAAANPIRTINLGDVAAETATGGIFLLNSGSGNVNVTSVTSCGATTAGLTAGTGDVELTNTAGAITLSEAVTAPGATVTLDASTSVVDNHAAGSDVVAGTLVLVTGAGGGVGSVGDPLDTAVAVLSFTNTSGGVHVINDSSAAVPAGSLTVSGTSTGTGAIRITEAGGDLLIGAGGLVTHSGPVRLAATAPDAELRLPAGVQINTTGGGTAGADITLIADNMDLAGSIIAGVGVVTIASSDAAQQIEVGSGASDSAATLGLTDAELSTVVTSGGLIVGSQTSTGGLVVVGPLDLAAAGNLSAGTLVLLSGAGDIEINERIVSPVNFLAATVGGDINFGPAGVIDAGANLVVLAATGGAINGDAAAFTNVVARGLAASAANGVGGQDAIETNVGTLAALNTTTGNIDIANNSGGAPLTIGTVGPRSGVVNNAPAAAGGDITVTNAGALRVNADVLATGGGDITLTADLGPGPLFAIPTNVQINARVHATGGSGNVTLNSALGRTALNEAVAGAEVVVTGAGEVLGTFGVTFAGGATISTATGSVGSQSAALRNVAAAPVDILGFTSVSGGFGDPGDFSFNIAADFSIDPVQTASFGPPGTFLFTQLFVKSPNANPAAPITITVTLVRTARVRIVENTAIVVVEAPVPGEGFGATFFELTTDTPELVPAEQKTAAAVLAVETTTPVLVQAQTFASAIVEPHANVDERVLILRVLRRDGSLKEDLEFRGQEAEAILDDLQGFLARLPDGRYRLLLKEPGRQRLRLVRDLTLEGGVPRSDFAHDGGDGATVPVMQDAEGGDLPGGLEPVSRPATPVEAGDGTTSLDVRGGQSAIYGRGSEAGGARPAAHAPLAAAAALGISAGLRSGHIDRFMETLSRGPRRATSRRFLLRRLKEQ